MMNSAWLKGLLPPELQSWVTIEGTTEGESTDRSEELATRWNSNRLGERMGYCAGDGSAQSTVLACLN